MPGASDEVATLRHELERVRASLADAERERDVLDQLSTAGRAIAAELDHHRLAQTVIDAATQLTGAELGAFFYTATADRIDTDLRYAIAGAARHTFAGLPMPRNTELLAPAFLGQAAIRLADVTRDPRHGKNYPNRGVPDGHPAVRSYLAVPVMSSSGASLGGIFLGHPRVDVFTDRAERIASVLAAHAAIAMDHALRHNEAQRVLAELEKASAEIDQLAHAASHDLRGPLRGITNLASWINEDLPDTTSPTIRDHLRLLEARAARMDQRIQGLVELSRIGRARHKPERVDVTELIHETIELANPRDAARIMMIGELPVLFTERAALHQVFTQLIDNALQHAGRDDVVVRISAIDRGDPWELSVVDNGVGIAAEHHERVWQLFQTIPADRDDTLGIGVGLSIVRKQVEHHGGRAWLDAATPTGAAVRFTWPKRTR
jgi:signal transduction histidine kinase